MATARQPGIIGTEPTNGDNRTAVATMPRAYRPDPVCHDDSWPVVRYAHQVAYVAEAWQLAELLYVWPSILRHAGKDFLELIKGILPVLLMAFGAVIVTTGVFAVIGGLASGIASGGLFAAPGAVAGGELGFTVGMWLLDFLGFSVLVVYVADSFAEAGKLLARGIKRAWYSCGVDSAIDAAAHDIGESFGHFFDALFQGIVAYVAEKGMDVALNQLNKSKIAVGLRQFFKTDDFRNATVDWWLKKLGKPGEPKFVRDRMAVVIEFVRDKARGLGGERYGSKKIGEVLQGTDFNTLRGSPQDLVQTLKPGETLIQRQDAKWGGANWFSKSGYSAADVGLAAGSRGFKQFEVLKPFEAVETRAASIDDSWTTGRQGASETAKGGGAQYFAEKHVDDLVAQGYLKVVYNRPPGPKPLSGKGGIVTKDSGNERDQ